MSVDAVHEGEVAAVVYDLDVEVESASSTRVRVTGENPADLKVAEERLRRAEKVSQWAVSRDGDVLSVENTE